jgi:hypothetical protein
VCFARAEDPGNFAQFVLPAPPLPRETDIEQTVDELRDQYPKQYPSRQPRFVGARGELGFIPPGEHERYNRDVDRFLSDYKKFLHDTDEMEAAFKRCIRFQIEIHNKGTAPADDVDVSFHFPDGFQLFSKDNLPAYPEKPDPPIEPRTTTQIMMDNASRVLDSGISSAMDREFKLRESFSIKRTNSYNVTDHFDRIKHGDHKRLRELFLIFDSYESASPFTCDFNLRVANLPKPVTGQLHFVIEGEK